jgi:glycosyltransferase involved in cell wall biosynthesis
VKHSTLLLIPAYHEAARIGAVVQAVRASGVAADILIVDDGSEDTTALEARLRGAEVLRHPFNLGYGAALNTGYLYARRRGYQRLLQMDADGQHDADSLHQLIAALDQGADVVVGSRYLEGRRQGATFARRLGSRLFSWIVTRWTGVRITDPTSGFQGMSQRAIAEVARDIFPEDYPDADVLIMLARAGLKLAEVPVTMHDRQGGRSMHGGSRVAYYAYKMFLTLLLLPVRRQAMTGSSARRAEVGAG